MFHSVILKTRNISWLSGCCKSRFRSNFRKFLDSEMPAVQFNNCEKFHISFEPKHNKNMKWKNMCIYLGAFHSQNCFKAFFIWIRTELIVCISKLLNTLFIPLFFSGVTTICLPAIWRIVCFSNLTRCKSGKRLGNLKSH